MESSQEPSRNIQPKNQKIPDFKIMVKITTFSRFLKLFKREFVYERFYIHLCVCVCVSVWPQISILV